MYSWESEQSPVDIYFLTNVVYCRGPEEQDAAEVVAEVKAGRDPFRGTITGTMVSMEEFKQAVADYLAANGLDSVLYNMHGFNNGPGWAFNQYGVRFQTYYQDLTKWLLIPIMWRNPWEVGAASYFRCRRGPAVRGGKLLAANVDVFKAPYTTYMMVSGTRRTQSRCRVRRQHDTSPLPPMITTDSLDGKLRVPSLCHDTVRRDLPIPTFLGTRKRIRSWRGNDGKDLREALHGRGQRARLLGYIHRRV